MSSESDGPSGDRHWWAEDVPDRTREDVLTAVENARSLGAVEQALYDVSGDFNQSPFDKGTQYYVEIVTTLREQAVADVPWNQSTGFRVPEFIRPHVRELYEQAQQSDDSDDILEA